MARVSKKLYKFTTDDKVKWKTPDGKTLKGYVVEMDETRSHFPLKVEFENGTIEYFSLEGFYELFNDKPDLVLIENK